MKNCLKLVGFISFLFTLTFAAEDIDWKEIYSEIYSNNILDTNKWTYEDGYLQKNNQNQCYTQNPANIQMANNLLTIRINQQSYPPYGCAFTSASIKTQSKFQFLFGKIQIEAQLPIGDGYFTSAYLQQSNCNESVFSQFCSKIYIFDFYGQSPLEISGRIFLSQFPAEKYWKRVNFARGFQNNLVKFALYWTRDYLSWVLDDIQFYRITRAELGSNWNFDKQYYFGLKAGVGGNYAGPVTGNTIFPQSAIFGQILVSQTLTMMYCNVIRGEIYDPVAQRCTICSYTCKSCRNYPDFCQTCDSPRVLTQQNSTIQTCQLCSNPHQYYDEKTKACAVCDNNCQTCVTTAQQCSSCETNMVIDGITFQCVFDQFPYVVNCHEYCGTCWKNFDPFYCQTCAANRSLQNSNKKYVKTCECPKGTTDTLLPGCDINDQQDTYLMTTWILAASSAVITFITSIITKSPFLFLGPLESIQFLSYFFYIRIQLPYGVNKILTYIYYSNFNYGIPRIDYLTVKKSNEINNTAYVPYTPTSSRFLLANNITTTSNDNQKMTLNDYFQQNLTDIFSLLMFHCFIAILTIVFYFAIKFEPVNPKNSNFTKSIFFQNLQLISVVYTSSEIYLISLFQMSHPNFSTNLNIFGFVICLLFIQYSGFFMIYFCYSVNKQQYENEIEEQEQKNQFSLVFDNLSNDFAGRNLLMLIFIKKIAFSATIVFQYDQIDNHMLTVITIEFFYWIYIAITRPLQNIIVLIHHLFTETLTLAISLAFFMAYFQVARDTQLLYTKIFIYLIFILLCTHIMFSILMIVKKILDGRRKSQPVAPVQDIQQNAIDNKQDDFADFSQIAFMKSSVGGMPPENEDFMSNVPSNDMSQINVMPDDFDETVKNDFGASRNGETIGFTPTPQKHQPGIILFDNFQQPEKGIQQNNLFFEQDYFAKDSKKQFK